MTSAFEDMLTTLIEEGYAIKIERGEYIGEDDFGESFGHEIKITASNNNGFAESAEGINLTDTMQDVYSMVPE
jgi:hypothetical protein